MRPQEAGIGADLTMGAPAILSGHVALSWGSESGGPRRRPLPPRTPARLHAYDDRALGAPLELNGPNSAITSASRIIPVIIFSMLPELSMDPDGSRWMPEFWW